MRTPDWWPFVLLALAAFRCVRLVGWDDVTAGLRKRALGLGDAEYGRMAAAVRQVRDDGEDPWRPRPIEEVYDVGALRFYVNELARCPWCVGSYIVVAWWLAWLAWPHATLVAAAPFALGAVVGLVAKNLDP